MKIQRIFTILVLLIGILGTAYAQQTIIEQVEWNSDGTRLLLAYNTGLIKVINSSNTVIFELEHNLAAGEIFTTAEWHPSNPDLLAIVENNLGTLLGKVSIIDIITGQVIISTSQAEGETVRDIAWSLDGQIMGIAIGFFHPDLYLFRAIRIWDTTTGEDIAYIPYNKNEITTLSWSPDGSRLVSSALDLRIVVWDANTGQEIYAISVPNTLHDIAWSLDGTKIASGEIGDNANLRIWDALAGTNIFTIPDISTSDLEWNPDSIRLATSNFETNVKIWNANTGELLETIEMLNAVYDVAWSPDGSSLAIATNEDLPIIIRFPTNLDIDPSPTDANNE